MLYILKIKGTNKIPDFVQIRDANMILIAFFRLSLIKQGLKKNDLEILFEITRAIQIPEEDPSAPNKTATENVYR